MPSTPKKISTHMKIGTGLKEARKCPVTTMAFIEVKLRGREVFERGKECAASAARKS